MGALCRLLGEMQPGSTTTLVQAGHGEQGLGAETVIVETVGDPPGAGRALFVGVVRPGEDLYAHQAADGLHRGGRVGGVIEDPAGHLHIGAQGP